MQCNTKNRSTCINAYIFILIEARFKVVLPDVRLLSFCRYKSIELNIIILLGFFYCDWFLVLRDFELHLLKIYGIFRCCINLLLKKRLSCCVI